MGIFSYKASLILLHSTGAGGSLGAGSWPEESVPYSNRLPGSKARLRTGETRNIFGKKGGEEFNMMISLFDDPMIRMETENDDFSISLFEHDDFSIDLGLKKRRKPPANPR